MPRMWMPGLVTSTADPRGIASGRGTRGLFFVVAGRDQDPVARADASTAFWMLRRLPLTPANVPTRRTRADADAAQTTSDAKAPPRRTAVTIPRPLRPLPTLANARISPPPLPDQGFNKHRVRPAWAERRGGPRPHSRPFGRQRGLHAHFSSAHNTRLRRGRGQRFTERNARRSRTWTWLASANDFRSGKPTSRYRAVPFRCGTCSRPPRAPRARSRRRSSSAASTLRAAAAASANTPSRVAAERAVEQLDDLEHGHARPARARSGSRP